MIRAYPRYPSLFPGETLVLHVSTASPRFRVEFYRQGAELERMADLGGPLDGISVPDGPPDFDWGWPGYAFEIPGDWPGGVYVAMFIEIAADGSETAPDRSTTFATEAKALFVVRRRGAAQPGTILYKLSWATFVAYNGTGYGSVYAEGVWSRERPNPGFKVTWRRPGCGTGGMVMPGDGPDYYDLTSRRQTFEHWDAPFVRWLERRGYPVDYCTDWDLHQDRDLLAPYSLLLSTGHDEYWSDDMRAALDRHVMRGGNLAFFSGNISGYRIHFSDDDTAITCAKIGAPTTSHGNMDPTKSPDKWEIDHWFDVRPESRLTGVATAFGGGWWDGKRDTLGYTVQHAGHWVFGGTGLKEGDVFGDDEEFPLIGYEVDGAAYKRKNGLAMPTGEGGTPRDFVILGVAELGEGWVASRPHAAATMGIYVTPRGGIVFQGATTDWPILVSRNRHVEKITSNLLDNLRLPSTRLIGPLPAKGGRMLAAVGETVTFHVDTAGVAAAGKLDVAWSVSGAEIVERGDRVLRLKVPAAPGFVTIAAAVSSGGTPIGFGTKTIATLSEKEAIGLDLLISLREMAMAGEPSNPLVAPTLDPQDRLWLLYRVRLPWIRDRATRVHDAAKRWLAQDQRESRGEKPEDGA